MLNDVNLQVVKNAKKRIDKFVRNTPLIYSPFFSRLCEGKIYVKLENLQITNSFKIRGAYNRIFQLTSEERSRGIITASSGNHAQGVALAANQLGISVKIVVPANISNIKLKKIKQYNSTIIQDRKVEAIESRAKEISIQESLIYISPYNDMGIIAGQGTIGLEVYQELSHIHSIIVPIGGGGLISGIGLVAKSIDPKVKIIGIQTEGASTMYQSWKAKKVIKVNEFPTITEGLSGGLDANALTFKMINKYIDEITLVQEESIKKAITLLWEEEGQIVEGAGAVGIAHILEAKQKFANQDVVVIISGANIDNSLFKELIKKQ